MRCLLCANPHCPCHRAVLKWEIFPLEEGKLKLQRRFGEPKQNCVLEQGCVGCWAVWGSTWCTAMKMARAASGQAPAVLQSCILSSASTELVQDEVGVKVKYILEAFFSSGTDLSALKPKYCFTKVKYCLTSDFVGEHRVKWIIKYRLGQNATTSLYHAGTIQLLSLISNLLWNTFP